MISSRTHELLSRTIVWDNHACMPLRPNDDSFLPQLERHKNAGVSLVCLNVTFDLHPPIMVFEMLASLRHWILRNADKYCLVQTIQDVEQAKKQGRLGIAFDIEGGRAVEAHPGMVELLYKLGVRWMLIAYNKNNRLGGGCQDKDPGLTGYGREIVDEMERVGMVLCCSHTGYRTAREAIEYSRNPVIFSHSNPRGVWDHDRNIPDDLMIQCAAKGGVVNINGIGVFLGENDNSTEAIVRHIEYAVTLVGPDHVGIGLDYCFDQAELDEYTRSRPDLWPPDKGYLTGMKMIEPERIPKIAEELVNRGYKDLEVQGILGHNNLRVARQIWR